MARTKRRTDCCLIGTVGSLMIVSRRPPCYSQPPVNPARRICRDRPGPYTMFRRLFPLYSAPISCLFSSTQRAGRPGHGWG